MERTTTTWRLTLSYRGSEFSGWQQQPGVRTVQVELEKAMAALTGGPVAARVAGRTDAGVHARGQVVSARFESAVEAQKMPLALNAHLPEDISVTRAEPMPGGFDAKRHAVGKRYVYRVLHRNVRDPLDAIGRWHVRGALDIEPMVTAARFLVGERDFNSFRASDCQAAHARRYLWRVSVHPEGEGQRSDRLYLDVRGNAFCKNMVRVIAGTLVDVGLGRLSANDIPRILLARDRKAAGRTAPAEGLTLEQVYYPDRLERAFIPKEARFPRFPPTAESWPPPEQPFEPEDEGADDEPES
jgi:tRNA pseudouridine38-40 synthase